MIRTLVASAILVGIAACVHDSHVRPVDVASLPACCRDAAATDGWCEHCNVGFYQAGGQVTSTTCQSCATAARSNGWCEGCSVGYHDGQAIHCQGCHAAANGGPPCPTCSQRQGS